MQFNKISLTAAAVLTAGVFSASAFAAPVTAEGSGVGKHGDITVAVTFDNGRIQDIKVVKSAENPILPKRSIPISRMPSSLRIPRMSRPCPARRSRAKASRTP